MHVPPAAGPQPEHEGRTGTSYPTGAPEAPRFDPMTGRPLTPPPAAFRFDPMTGRPLTPVDTRPRGRGLGIGLVAVLLLAALGGGGMIVLDQRERPGGDAGPAGMPEADPEADLAAEQEDCEAAIGDYLDALEAVDARLDVGLNVTAYTEAVGDAAVERSDVDEDAAEGIDFCGSALEAADAAALSYATAGTEWDDCIWEDYCEPDLDVDLQGPWLDSATMLEAAAEAIDSGEPIDPASDTGESIDDLGTAI